MRLKRSASIFLARAAVVQAALTGVLTKAWHKGTEPGASASQGRFPPLLDEHAKGRLPDGEPPFALNLLD